MGTAQLDKKMIQVDINIVHGKLKALARYSFKGKRRYVLFDSGSALVIWSDSLDKMIEYFGGPSNCSRVPNLTAYVNGFGLRDCETYDVYRVNQYIIATNILDNYKKDCIRFKNLYVVHKRGAYAGAIIFPLCAFKGCKVSIMLSTNGINPIKTIEGEEVSFDLLRIETVDTNVIELKPRIDKKVGKVIHMGVECEVLDGLTFAQEESEYDKDIFREEDYSNNDEPKKMMDLIDPHLDELY